MRPPEFTGGNVDDVQPHRLQARRASMRPPEFTGGNGSTTDPGGYKCQKGFNEAAGIHRGNILEDLHESDRHRTASMRPPEFTGGNLVRSRGLSR